MTPDDLVAVVTPILRHRLVLKPGEVQEEEIEQRLAEIIDESRAPGNVALDGKLLLQEIRGRPIDLVPGKKVVSINPGEWTSPFEGKGYEPFGYRDFPDWR